MNGIERILSICDAAVPVEAPPVPLAVSPAKSARRQARPARSSADQNPASQPATDQPTALQTGSAAQERASPDPASAGAAAPPVADNVVSFRTSSQKGGSAA